MAEREEQAYIECGRVAWIAVLQEVLRQLGVDDPAAGQAWWVSERQQAIAALRSLCAEFGDNEWPDNLHLADAINKHLGDHLRA